ncbi:MAG: maltose alpha-D-glucosyltransferase [Salinivirgaceae bacterium]|nr:MAG: maltose alpha-D-glucosyltransferase [Salinivirgaceae bacterium]
MTNNQSIDDNILWYKDAIIYELHIKAFMDSNGDGIGDFAGLLSRLDYLEDLGVTVIWLLPFYPSPLKDDGYDIADYYSINPSYGNIRDFKKFINAAHQRNIRVITELVLNHTSDQHPWFQRARKSPKGSPERDYYVWTDDTNQYKGVRIIFQDYEKSNWSWDPVAEQYYWHRFFHHQPDLNYDNPKVQHEVFRIIDYWLKMGVDGFRLDAVPYLFQREGTNCENLPETHAFLKKLRKHVDDNHKGKMLLAEANMWPEDSAAYFGGGDECHMNYHFPIMPRMFMAMRMEDKYPITDMLDQTPEIPDTCQWAIFLRNHDELTLEMVTDEERDYMYKVYAQNPKAKINLGIRQRLAPLLENNRRKIELMNYLLFSLPGTPVIYYGDEIGMGDNFYLGDRDGVRTPMQWSPDRNAGFSNANPHKLYLPLILDPLYHYESVNVETQQASNSSLLWWMKRIINMRKRFKAFGRGNIEFINIDNPKVLAFTRTYEDETILVVFNFSRFAQIGELDLGKYTGYVPVEVFSKNSFPIIHEDRNYILTLSPHDYYWFQLKKKKTSIDSSDLAKSIQLNKWSDLFSKEIISNLELEVLPGFFRASKWFESKNHKITSTKIIEHIDFSTKEKSVCNTLVEVHYESRLKELYQVCLAFAPKGSSISIVEDYPEAIISPAQIGNDEGYIYDGFFDPEIQLRLFKNIVNRKKILTNNGTVRFLGNKKLSNYVNETEEIKPRMMVMRRTNTSIMFNNDYNLKIYRKLDTLINPDLQISEFLSKKIKFPYIPTLAGRIELESSGFNIVLGKIQEAEDYQNDARHYMLDNLQRFYENIQMRNDNPEEYPLKGSLTTPLSHQQIEDKHISELLNMLAVEQIRLLGERTAELHLALSSDKDDPEFDAEEFSLHYQRSLYSSYQSPVRETYQLLAKKHDQIPESIINEVDKLLPLRHKVLDVLKKIYSKKLDIYKIRTHGNLKLRHVLFTGRDFIFINFEGRPGTRYSQRRLKKSPIADIASMLSSFHYVAYEAIMKNQNIRREDFDSLQPWAEKWYHYMGQIFIKAYLDKVNGSMFIPENEEDFENTLNVFLLETTIQRIHNELIEPSQKLIIPVIQLLRILDRYKD